ncbi:MAG: hypothetical protein QNK37_25635 [Acidobacteriota bacterium]|nr:hypothetical protein [Acidobacteriota bacterium]
MKVLILLSMVTTPLFGQLVLCENCRLIKDYPPPVSIPNTWSKDLITDSFGEQGDYPFEVGALLEMDSFRFGDSKGDNLSLGASYRYRTDKDRVYGLRVYQNQLSLTSPELTLHYQVVQLNAQQQRKRGVWSYVYGATLGNMFMEKSYAENSPGFGIYNAWQRPLRGGGLLGLGTLLYAVESKQVDSRHANGAVYYRQPLKGAWYLDLDLFYVYSDFKVRGRPPDWDKSFLDLGANLKWNVSPAVALVLGAKTVLTFDHYTSLETTLGSGIRF